MNEQDRLEALKRKAFADNYHVDRLLACGDYPTLQDVISCEKYRLDYDQPETVRIGKSVYRVQELLTDPEWFDFVVCNKVYHVSEPPPPLTFNKKGYLVFPPWPSYVVEERKWTIKWE